MIARSLVVLVLVGALVVPAAALGTERKPDTSHFYIMDTQMIDGKIKRPAGLYTSGQKRAEFGRLLRLARSFDKEISASAKEAALR